ncbi:solute carrier family 52, riboflavin transporter, member 3 [Elysia marginata]|uniref:Riboflavin transporter n=1 Tax=Elysia marginata TaxID=1093978 RepID=A0AAV4I1R4_9GAST|nr:solute carrier family 52, riboflavin transporter, member 3 [Elysia marginata]
MADKESVSWSNSSSSSPKPKSKRPGRGRLYIHVLVVIFGITSWSVMNGLWVELPILVAHLPEGWTLPSDLTIVAQAGNLGPLAFTLLVYLFPRVKLEVPASLLIVVVLSLCALFYSFFWEHTATVAGSEYSVALLSLTFVQSVFAAMTSQAYLAFMSHLKARYMSSLFLGMGLSGLLPALVAVAQGSGTVTCTSEMQNATHPKSSLFRAMGDVGTENRTMNYLLVSTNTTGTEITKETHGLRATSLEPALTVQHFFLFLLGLGVCSLASLLLLLYHPKCREEHVDTDKEENCQLMKLPKPENGSQDAEKADNVTDDLINDKFENHIDGTMEEMVTETNVLTQTIQDKDTAASDDKTSYRGKTQLGRWESWYLLILLAWINAVQTSFLLAIQVYSSLPYGLRIYNGATKAENIVDPIACFITIFVTAKTSRWISGLTLVGTLLASYIITVAARSPSPLLVDHIAGGVLVILFWICCTMVMVYTKVSIAAVMRSQGRLSLIWTGASTQIGSFIGAVLAYLMVNHLRFFRDAPWCDEEEDGMTSAVV